MVSRVVLFVLALCLLNSWPSETHAYIGPGAGLSAVGTFIALVGAVLLAIVGFVWYPMKRMLKGRKSKQNNSIEKK